MRFPKVIGLVLGFFLLGASLVYGVTYLSVITMSATITSGTSTVIPYLDAEATQKIIMLDAGILERNQAWVETIYLKNEGTAQMTVSMMTEGQTGFGFVMFAPTGEYVLEPAEVLPVEISVWVFPQATPGTYNFSIIIFKD